jgi:hypothetical protein
LIVTDKNKRSSLPGYVINNNRHFYSIVRLLIANSQTSLEYVLTRVLKIVLKKNYDTGTEGDFVMKRATLFYKIFIGVGSKM